MTEEIVIVGSEDAAGRMSAEQARDWLGLPPAASLKSKDLSTSNASSADSADVAGGRGKRRACAVASDRALQHEGWLVTWWGIYRFYEGDHAAPFSILCAIISSSVDAASACRPEQRVPVWSGNFTGLFHPASPQFLLNGCDLLRLPLEPRSRRSRAREVVAGRV